MEEQGDGLFEGTDADGDGEVQQPEVVGLLRRLGDHGEEQMATTWIELLAAYLIEGGKLRCINNVELTKLPKLSVVIAEFKNTFLSLIRGGDPLGPRSSFGIVDAKEYFVP